MRTWITAAALIGAGLLAAPAAASSLELRFTTDRPGASSGLQLAVTYPEGSYIEDVRIDAPTGTRIDPSAVPMCTAGDDQLRLGGLAACPRETRIGRGTVTVRTGLLPGRTTFDLVVVAAPGQIVEVVLIPGTEMVIAVERLTVDGATLTAHPPAVPGGPPDFRTSIEDVRFVVAAPAFGRPAVFTTPAVCDDGSWESSGRFGFAGGTVEQASDAAPCAAAAKRVKRRAKRCSRERSRRCERRARPPRR